MDILLEFLDRPKQLPVAAAVFHEADVLSSVQTLKSTSPSRLAFLSCGKLGAESLVAAHGGTHSLDLARAGSYPLLAEGDLVLAWKFPH